MSRSAAEGLRMMQGGVDRTGFADMYESLGDPLARIRANREAARQQALLDAMMEVDDTEPGDTEPAPEQSLEEKQEIDLVPGGAFDKALTGGLTGSLFGLPGAAVGTGMGIVSQGYEDMMNRIVGEFDEGGSFEGGLSYGDDADYLENLNRVFEMGSMQGGLPMADGGRVEMQLGGGLMNNLLGQPGVQQALQNQIYQQPGFGSEISIGGPDGPITIPGPGYGPGISPPPVFPPVNIPEAQAYNPFVSTMPLYDPSTLGTGLPSTAGMVDPYFVYDRYSPAGAFDAPPANIGGFLSRKEIEKGFSDLDKFTLTKQEEKKKAAQAAAKAVKKPKDTEGKDGSKSN